MKKRTCLRCGSMDLYTGVIFDQTQYAKSPLIFRRKSELQSGPDYVPLNAILCKTCGHIELLANPGSFIQPRRRECPHCGAIYSYRIEDEILTNVVRCYNCNKEFGIHPPIVCPSCGATYLYSKERVIEGTVVCQNCEMVILVEDSYVAEE